MAQKLKEGTFYNYPPRNWDDSPGPTKPAINYGNNLSTAHMKPIFVCRKHFNFYLWSQSS